MNEYIGIDIGGTKISVIRGDAAGNILEKKKFATKTKDETLKEIFEDVSELMNEHVTSIGVSCGGPLNSKTGVILGPPNLPGRLRRNGIRGRNLICELSGLAGHL